MAVERKLAPSYDSWKVAATPSIWIKVNIDTATSDFLTAVVAKDANGIVIKV